MNFFSHKVKRFYSISHTLSPKPGNSLLSIVSPALITVIFSIIIHNNCCEASQQTNFGHVTSLGCLRQKPSSFENLALHLPRFPVIEIEALSILKNLDH